MSNNWVIPNTEVEVAPLGTVSSNEDQQGIFPSEKQLKFSTDNRHQWKKSREYAEAVVNIPGDSAVSSTTKKL